MSDYRNGHPVDTDGAYNVTLVQDAPWALSAGVNSILRGGIESELVSPADAVTIALSVAVSVAVEQSRRGEEVKALDSVEGYFRAVMNDYRRLVQLGRITGQNNGGFDRPRRNFAAARAPSVDA